MADLCEQVDANVQEVARGIGLDNRIGTKFLHAGPGLRWLVLSQGYAGADQDGAGLRSAHCAWSRPLAAVNDQRKRAMARKVDRSVRRQRARQDNRDSWA